MNLIQEIDIDKINKYFKDNIKLTVVELLVLPNEINLKISNTFLKSFYLLVDNNIYLAINEMPFIKELADIQEIQTNIDKYLEKYHNYKRFYF